VSDLHHTVLPDVSILHSTEACAAPGPDVSNSNIRHYVLPLDVSVQQQLAVSLSVLKKLLLHYTYLFYNNPRTYLF
jgi:hypothetical protein